MGERAAWGKMTAMCGRSTPLGGNADETSSLYIYLWYWQCRSVPFCWPLAVLTERLCSCVPCRSVRGERRPAGVYPESGTRHRQALRPTLVQRKEVSHTVKCTLQLSDLLGFHMSCFYITRVTSRVGLRSGVTTRVKAIHQENERNWLVAVHREPGCPRGFKKYWRW